MDSNLQRLKEGDEKVFRAIVSSLWIRLYKFAAIYIMNNEVAKEIAQDSFLTLWEHRKLLTDDTCIASYLLVVNRNKCLDYLRKRQIELVSLDELNEERIYLKCNEAILADETQDILVAKELEQAIAEAIERLPRKTRVVFLKSRTEGLSNKEIAAELGISVKTVEFHLTKALQQLRTELSKEYFSMAVILLFLRNWPHA